MIRRKQNIEIAHLDLKNKNEDLTMIQKQIKVVYKPPRQRQPNQSSMSAGRNTTLTQSVEVSQAEED